MLRKITTTCAILAASISTAALADMCSGGYIGANVGLIDSLYRTNGAAAGDVFSQSAGSRGFTGGVFGGYGFKQEDRYYIGGELQANYTNNKVNIITLRDTLDGSSENVNVKAHFGYGFSIIPGVLLSHNLLGFFRVGILNTRFDVNASADGVSVSSNQYSIGGEFGAGIQARISDTMSLRGEYIYTTYRSFNALGMHFVPSSDQINLGMVFSFG